MLNRLLGRSLESLNVLDKLEMYGHRVDGVAMRALGRYGSKICKLFPVWRSAENPVWHPLVPCISACCSSRLSL